jgi:hypothetical protein
MFKINDKIKLEGKTFKSKWRLQEIGDTFKIVNVKKSPLNTIQKLSLESNGFKLSPKGLKIHEVLELDYPIDQNYKIINTNP